MYPAVVILMILVVFVLCLRLTFLKPGPLVLLSLAFALFCGFIWPLAIRQSRLGIEAWMENPALMKDTAVLITVEAFLQMAYCVLAAGQLYGGVPRKASVFLHKALGFFPGLLVFAVLLLVQVRLLYAFPGLDFRIVAWSMAGGVLLLLPTLSLVIKRLLREQELRLELLFLSSVLELVLGVVTT